MFTEPVNINHRSESLYLSVFVSGLHLEPVSHRELHTVRLPRVIQPHITLSVITDKRCWNGFKKLK